MKSNTITLLTNASMTGTDTITSAPIPLDQIYGYAIQASWTGTPTGTFSLQASSESPPTQSQVANGGPDNITLWDTIANSSYSIAGSSGTYMWNVNLAFYRYVQLVYTNTSGTGSLSAIMSAKGI